MTSTQNAHAVNALNDVFSQLLHLGQPPNIAIPAPNPSAKTDLTQNSAPLDSSVTSTSSDPSARAQE